MPDLRPDPDTILDDLIPRASFDGPGPLEMTVAELCAVNWVVAKTFTILAVEGPVLEGDTIFGREVVLQPMRED